MLHPDEIYVQTGRTLISCGVDLSRGWKCSLEIWPWHHSVEPILQICQLRIHASLLFCCLPKLTWTISDGRKRVISVQQTNSCVYESDSRPTDQKWDLAVCKRSPKNTHHQPEPIIEYRMDWCFHAVYTKAWPHHLNVAADIDTHQARQPFSNLLVSNLESPHKWQHQFLFLDCQQWRHVLPSTQHRNAPLQLLLNNQPEPARPFSTELLLSPITIFHCPLRR